MKTYSLKKLLNAAKKEQRYEEILRNVTQNVAKLKYRCENDVYAEPHTDLQSLSLDYTDLHRFCTKYAIRFDADGNISTVLANVPKEIKSYIYDEIEDDWREEDVREMLSDVASEMSIDISALSEKELDEIVDEAVSWFEWFKDSSRSRNDTTYDAIYETLYELYKHKPADAAL